MKYLAMITLICCFIHGKSQNFNWITTAGYSNQVDIFYGAIEIEKDQNDNLYCFDVVSGNQISEGIEIPIESSGLNTIIYKYDSMGYFLSGSAIGGNFNFCAAEIDDYNNLYVLGNATNNSFIYQGTTYNLNQGSFKQVLLKFNSNGQLIWYKETGYSGLPRGVLLEYSFGEVFFQTEFTSVCSIDTSGELMNTLPFFYQAYQNQENVYGLPLLGSDHFSNGDILLAANIRGNVSWIENDTISSVQNANSILLTRFTRDFQPIWSKIIPSLNLIEGKSIPISINSDDVIFAGIEINDSLNFAGTIVVGNTASIQGALISLNSDGTERWISHIQSIGNTKLNAIEYDPFHNLIWCAGFIESTSTFGDTSILIQTDQLGNGFLAAVNLQGEFVDCFSPNSNSITEGKSLRILNSEQLLVGFRNASIDEHVWSCINFQNQGGLILSSYRFDPFDQIIANITANENILSASFAGEIQWLLDGNPIDGETSTSIQANSTGLYSATLDYPGDCLDPVESNSIYVSVDGLDQIDSSVIIYPQPCNEKIILKSNEEFNNYRIYTSSGILVQEGVIYHSMIQIDELTPGMYILLLRNNFKIETKRFIK